MGGGSGCVNPLSENALSGWVYSLIFHSHSCRFHSCHFFVFLKVFVYLPKHHQNWIELVIRGLNLIECDKIGVKTTYYTVKCVENYEIWGGYMLFGGLTHLVHDTKWGGGVGSSKIFQNPTLCPFEGPSTFKPPGQNLSHDPV